MAKCFNKSTIYFRTAWNILHVVSQYGVYIINTDRVHTVQNVNTYDTPQNCEYASIPALTLIVVTARGRDCKYIYVNCQLHKYQ